MYCCSEFAYACRPLATRLFRPLCQVPELCVFVVGCLNARPPSSFRIEAMTLNIHRGLFPFRAQGADLLGARELPHGGTPFPAVG